MKFLSMFYEKTLKSETNTESKTNAINKKHTEK